MSERVFWHVPPMVFGAALALVMLLTGGVSPVEHLAPLATAGAEDSSDFILVTEPTGELIHVEPSEPLPLHVTCEAPHEASMLGMAWRSYPVDAYGLAGDVRTSQEPIISHDWATVFPHEGEYRVDVLCHDALTGWFEETSWTVHVGTLTEEPTL